jgi:hypothetical protein
MNVRDLIIKAKDLLINHDIAPFCPALDLQYFINLRGEEQITMDLIKKQSMAWLERSDAILVVPGYEESTGTIDEIKRAKELEIPVFFKDEDLIAWLELAKGTGQEGKKEDETTT